MRETTRLLHERGDRSERLGAVNPPVVHASLFGFETYQKFLDAYEKLYECPWYGRLYNPTVRVLEEKVAELENAETAIAFSSGMGAITAVLLALLSQGDHLLVVDSVFGPVRSFCSDTLTRLGIEVEYFPCQEAIDLSPRIQKSTRVIYVESRGRLSFDVQDLQAASATARAKGVYTAVDNTCATPLFQKPLNFGTDIVIHSGTKYLSGHSDLTMGMVACNREFFRRIKPLTGLLGANLSPDDAYLALRGLRTLSLRVMKHQDSGFVIAKWLQGRPEVREVLHPGLPSSPHYELASRQQSGFTGSFSVRLLHTSKQACHAFVDALKLFTIGASWGGYESLIMPVEYLHKDDLAWRARRGLDDALFRLSVGLEDPDDLIADLERGLNAWRCASVGQPSEQLNDLPDE